MILTGHHDWTPKKNNLELVELSSVNKVNSVQVFCWSNLFSLHLPDLGQCLYKIERKGNKIIDDYFRKNSFFKTNYFTSGQIPLTKETTKLLTELKTSRADVSICHGYTTQDSYQAAAPKHVSPCEILRDYASTNKIHSFQFFRDLSQSDAYQESISREQFAIGLRGLGVFDDHQINDVINILDRDKNGVIEYSEFMTIFA